jgi:GT2 family glycosyltransferase
MTKVAVVILNFNGANILKNFLPSVIKHTLTPYEIIVADNGSTDNSLEVLQNEFPEIKVLKSTINEGFSKGYNTALSQIEAEYYVLLNSDVEVTENWISPIIQLMESDKQIGACQPKILAYQDKNSFEYAGAAGGFIDKYGFPFCRGRIFDQLETDQNQYNNNIEIFWATGACMFVRSEAYHQLGGLDNDFFAHMEEIDLCWRMKNANYKIMYCAESTVYHLGGGTLHKSNPRKTFLNFRNGLALLYKNLPLNKLYATLFTRMLLDGIAAIKFLISGQHKDFWAVFMAHMNFYNNFSHWKNKRKECLTHNTQNTESQILDKSIVWEYFIKKNKIFSEIEF